MLYTFLLVLIGLLAVLLVLVILLQSGQGGGLAGVAAGNATKQVLGTRQAPDLLERITWTMGALFIVLCILTNFAIDRGDAQESVIQQRAGQQTEQPMPQQEPLQQEPGPGAQQPLPDQEPEEN